MQPPHSTSQSTDDKKLEQLRQAALRIASRVRTRHERTLIAMINSLGLPAYPREEVSRPPLELVQAMRSPKGAQRLVHTRVSGRHLKVVINPIGKPDPDREAAVWRCLIDLTEEHVA